MRFTNKAKGQASIEYLLILTFVALISFKSITIFRDFFKNSMGSLGNILTIHLTTGVCAQNCFFGGYKNGKGS